MSEVLEFAARISQVVGARPAGTEEEQQASFFIEEAMNEAGLDTTVEEFNCNPNYEISRIVCCVVSLVLAILAVCLPLMVIPAFLVCAAAAVFYILDMLGSSPLTNATKKGVSQNVVAKYYPGMTDAATSASFGSISGDGSAAGLDEDGVSDGGRRRKRPAPGSRANRKRKIIILARYDSGKVCRELRPPLFPILDKIHWAEIGGMVLIPVALLLRLLTGVEAEISVLWNVLVVIGAVCAVLPVISYILHQTAPYSEGANNNAAGVAVMVEVARRLAASSKPSLASKVIPEADGLPYSLPDPPAQIVGEDGGVLPVMHGSDAIRNSGVLPVGTDLIYDEAANGTLDSREPKTIAIASQMAEEAIEDSQTVAFVPSMNRSVDMIRAEAEAEVAQAMQEPQVSRDLPSIDLPEQRDAQERMAATHNGRPSALSLQAQMESASLEFAKYDQQQEGRDDSLLNSTEDNAAEDAVQAAVSETLSPEKAVSAMAQASIPQAPKPQSSVPDWFRKGMEAANANKQSDEGADKPVVQRSRFADALDAAHETTQRVAEEAAAAARAEQEARMSTINSTDLRRLAEVQERIMQGSTASLAAKAEVAAALADAEAADAQAAGNDATANVAEQAAAADRTISFIPVASDIPADMPLADASAKAEPKKTASEILDEAAAVAEVEPSARSAKKGRRSISLPSLTGALGGQTGSMQAAPLAEDAQREAGESRTALKNVGEAIQEAAQESVAASQQAQAQQAQRAQQQPQQAASQQQMQAAQAAQPAVSVGVSQPLEGATTSFLKANAENDAMAALSSLDAPSPNSVSSVHPVAGKQPQKAVQEESSAQVASAINAIPAISQNAQAVIPSLSTEPAQPAADAPIAVSTAGSFVNASETSNFEPVGDELIANMNQEEAIIEDVDDSDYTENITHTGAIAGPGYVDMPTSRVQRFKSLFGRKKDSRDDSISFADAVGIDSNFDAREVGKARGGWESFQNESIDYDNSMAEAEFESGIRGGHGSHVDSYSTKSHSLRFRREREESSAWDADAFDDSDWNGGAFSIGRRGSSDGEGSGRSSLAGRFSRGSDGRSSRGSLRGQASSGRARSADEVLAQEALEYEDEGLAAEDMLDERDQIRNFRSSASQLTSFEEVAAFASAFSQAAGGAEQEYGAVEAVVVEEEPNIGFQTEVWFVALGAELANNAGVKALLAEHGEDMRGSIVIDLDALGAGDLTLIDEEGVIKKVKASSRMRRYATKAASALGMRIGSGTMNWRESAAYFTGKRGLLTLHLCGMRDGKPAYEAEADDVFSNLDEEKLLENTAFVLELLNNI